MRAMGPQAATALRLVVDPAVPVIPARPIRRVADGLPADWEPLGMTDAARMALRAQEADSLRERVAELQIEVAHLSRQLEVEREQGRREERAVKARTMGGRVLSILTPGRQR